MSRFFPILVVLAALAILLAAPRPALACPSCEAAVGAPGDTDDDPLREARAYNDSILFMVAVPYALLAACAAALFLLYRKKVKLDLLNHSADTGAPLTAGARP